MTAVRCCILSEFSNVEHDMSRWFRRFKFWWTTGDFGGIDCSFCINAYSSYLFTTCIISILHFESSVFGRNVSVLVATKVKTGGCHHSSLVRIYFHLICLMKELLFLQQNWIFSCQFLFFDKWGGELGVLSRKYSFLIKKVIFIFVARRLFPFKKDLSFRNGFFAVFSKNYSFFWKNC